MTMTKLAPWYLKTMQQRIQPRSQSRDLWIRATLCHVHDNYSAAEVAVNAR